MGGGLANGLIAMRLELARPELRLILFESTETLGGNHTWCFHEDYLTSSQKEWLAPLVVHRWNHYSVHFPNKNRQLLSGYHAITSERFNSVLRSRLGYRARLKTSVKSLCLTRVCLADGTTLTARAVIDGRGI